MVYCNNKAKAVFIDHVYVIIMVLLLFLLQHQKSGKLLIIVLIIIVIIIIIIKRNRPDITLVHKDTQKWTHTDIAVPADQNITSTEEEKVEKYQELVFEIKRIHGASIIPIVIGAFGNISKGAKTWFGKVDVPDFLGSVQLSAILGVAHLLRKVLCLEATGSC